MFWKCLHQRDGEGAEEEGEPDEVEDQISTGSGGNKSPTFESAIPAFIRQEIATVSEGKNGSRLLA